MQQLNGGQIQTRQGVYSQDTCTTETDLVGMGAIRPEVRKMLEIKNKRYMMTLLTSGAVGPYGINNDQPTKIPVVTDKNKTFGSNAYRFDVIGRIEKAAIINKQMGASGADGSFTLIMQDRWLYDAQVVIFGSSFQARVMGYPTGSASSGWVYNFKSITGTVFSFATHVGTNLTCFPMFTAYGQGSDHSDSRSKSPDQFINHPTIQRTTAKITGSAESDVLWYSWTDDGQDIGWIYHKVNQMNAMFAMNDENHKWFSASTMKASDGSILPESRIFDEKGEPVYIGDGFQEQVSGTNTMTGSGTNGEATETDFEDIMKSMQIESNQIDGITWICVTGTDGRANAQRKLQNVLANQNVTIIQNVTQTNEAGGAKVNAGYNFEKLSINGNSVIFLTHPKFDDASMFPLRGNDGRLLMSGTYFLMGMGESSPTMEIIAKSANGINRSFVQAEYIGLTGKKGFVQSEVDADKVAILKEDLFCVYNPQTCGIIYKAS